MLTYLSRHLQVIFSTLGAMQRTPMASINTVLIIGIALLLPVCLYVTIKSGQALSDNWQGRPQISIFLRADTSASEAALIFNEIRLHPSVQLAELVTPQQALAEFRALSGLDYELKFLDDNPLPHSIVVMPDAGHARSEHLLKLQAQLSKIEGIETIRLDLEWTDRFNAILKAAAKLSLVLSALLAVALILIIGNTIRLLIFNRRHEIEITKLVGGTDSFVRRPFLYYGCFYGISGALVSLLLLWGTAHLLQQPMAELAALYQRSQLLYRLGIREIAVIVLSGAFIGWSAARWSVARHLRQIQPR